MTIQIQLLDAQCKIVGQKVTLQSTYFCFVLVGKPEGRRPLEKPRHRWEDNIKMDLRVMSWGMDWIDLAQDRDRWRAVVSAVMNLQVS
jgi:hypothetical protein